MPEAQYTYHFAMQQNTAYIPVDLSYAIGLPPEKAIEYFASKGLKTTLDWQSLWQESHIKAFTIAGAAKLDILQNVKDELDNALHKGIPLQEFKDSLIPRLQALGWLSSSPEKMPYRLENIYRTNMQTAFQAGRYREMMENVKDRPYWQYVAVMDSRTRPAHAALNNKIFRYDDPFWKSFYPPNGFQCRCRVRTFSEKDIEERNLTVESGKDNIVWEEKPIGGGYTKPTAAYIDPKTGEKYFTDAGWSYNPGERFWEKDLRRYDKDIRAAFEKEMAEFMATITQGAAVQGIIQRLNIEVKEINDINPILKEFEKDNPGLFAHGFTAISKVNENWFMSARNARGEIEVSSRTFPLKNNFNAKKDLISAMNKIGKGQALTFNEEYAIEALWHEIGHLRVKDYVFLGRGSTGQICMETVNQFTARHSYDGFLKQLGGTAAHKDAVLANGYGYSGWVRNFRALVNKIGVDETVIAPKLEQAITASYQNVVKDTTKILASETVKNMKLKTATAQKKALSKESGRVREALGLLRQDEQDFNSELGRIWQN
ncbi:MAG: phage minor head protein [Pseudomonadota bacterium]|nr:phage minor head protein [Pseudomonadota bacterium]